MQLLYDLHLAFFFQICVGWFYQFPPILFAYGYSPVRVHSFCTEINSVSSGIVEEGYVRLALCICGHVWRPIDGAAEVGHGRYNAVVFHFEGGRGVKSFEIGVAQSFVAGRGKFDVTIEIYAHTRLSFLGTEGHDI